MGLAAVEDHGAPLRSANLENLSRLVDRIHPVVLAQEQQLHLSPEVTEAFGGLSVARGITLGVSGRGATSLALDLIAGPSTAGSWIAIVGMGDLGLSAVGEHGVRLDRLAFVDVPDDRSFASATAALLDGFDVVVVPAQRQIAAGDARRLVARARERGTVLLRVGVDGARAAWPGKPDVELSVTGVEWDGLGLGHGHLTQRKLSVRVGGRRGHQMVGQRDVLSPTGAGRLAVIPDGNISGNRAPVHDLARRRAQLRPSA